KPTRLTVAFGDVYVPSPAASTLPDQYGEPSHEMSSRLANGPNRSTVIVAGVLPRPVTVSLSASVPPGVTAAAEGAGEAFGAARAIVVSDSSPQGLSNACTASEAAIDSW